MTDKMTQPTKEMIAICKTDKSSSFERQKQDCSQKWSNHLIAGPKWDNFIAMNQASEYQSI
jgi:hypothetical protein